MTMQFCEGCGALLPASEAEGVSDRWGTEFEQTVTGGGGDGSKPEKQLSTTTELEKLPTTKNGSIKKVDAIEWLDALSRPSSAESDGLLSRNQVLSQGVLFRQTSLRFA